MFHRRDKKPVSMQAKSLKNMTRIMPAAQLLVDEKRKALLEQMREITALEPSRYESLCQVLINNLLNYYQNLPESSHQFYAQSGGLIDYALNRTEAALSLFRQFVILDESAEFSEQQKLWQYALYSAALIKGIGKLYTDYRIDLYDGNGQLLKAWNPLLESLNAIGTYYDYAFEKEGEVEFRHRLNILLARAVMPESGYTWLASDPQVFAVWLALINEDERSAGTLGALLVRADAIAIQRYISQFMVKGHGARGGRLGRVGAFSDGTPESLIEKEQQMAAEIIIWLKAALADGRINLNKSPLLMVPGGLLMGVDFFKWFARGHPEYKNWQAAQTALLSLGLHEAGRDGVTEARFEQVKNQQIHSGVIIKDYAVVLPDQVHVHNMHTGKVTTQSALDVIHSAEHGNQFIRSQAASPASGMQQLNASGQWQQPEANHEPSPQPGVKGRG